MRLGESPTEARFADLEAQITLLKARVDKIEARDRTTYDDVIELAGESRPAISAEYWIGAKLLPRFGALLIILAIAFVAILESSKSQAVDRALLLGFEALFCLGFIAVGDWKRNELEGFGLTLVAIGSSGLYLTAAGGHFAYQTLSPATMAIGFALLTVLNHAYAEWRNSRLFFFIGAGGGLAAMLFPLAAKDYSTALAVYVTVTAAGAAVCALRKWLQLAIVGWFLGLLILVPIIDSDHSRVALLASMYAGSLACILAYSRSYTGQSLDPWALGAPVALFLTGLVGYIVEPSVWHLLLFSASGFLVARTVPRENIAGPSLQIGAAATAAVIVPLCFPSFAATFLYAALAVAAFVVGQFRLLRLSAVFAVLETAMAALGYWAAFRDGASAADQHVMLAALAVALLFSSLSLRRANLGWRGYAIGGLWILLTRWSVLIAEPGVTSYSTLTIVSSLYALSLLTLGFRLGISTLRYWSFAVMLTSVFQILMLEQDKTVGYRLTLLILIGVMMLVGGYRYVHERMRGSEGAP